MLVYGDGYMLLANCAHSFLRPFKHQMPTLVVSLFLYAISIICSRITVMKGIFWICMYFFFAQLTFFYILMITCSTFNIAKKTLWSCSCFNILKAIHFFFTHLHYLFYDLFVFLFWGCILYIFVTILLILMFNRQLYICLSLLYKTLAIWYDNLSCKSEF